MSKIIIHNNSDFSDLRAIEAVHRVVKLGFISGDNQYCWHSTYKHPVLGKSIGVYSLKTRGETHTFKCVNESDE